MNGSDGVSLDGMYHEEHALPSFVHARSKDQLRLPMSRLKGETPVIYFYTPQVGACRSRSDFPTGLWTQWYPQATTVWPGLVQAGSPPQTRDGRISWDVIVRPPNMKHDEPPATSSDALWNYARDVDAAYVTARQAGHAGAPPGMGAVHLLSRSRRGAAADRRCVSATDESPRRRPSAEGVRHVFILRVENGRGAYAYAPALNAGQMLDQAVPSMDHVAADSTQFVRQVSDDVARRLVESGLYEKEARAMVNTWTSSYFKTDGVRLLFVMPQSWTDRFIPMRIEPKPEAARARHGRPRRTARRAARERARKRPFGALASPDPAVRERAFETLRAEGRYVEPIVRRTLRTTTDEQVRTLSSACCSPTSSPSCGRRSPTRTPARRRQHRTGPSSRRSLPACCVKSD